MERNKEFEELHERMKLPAEASLEKQLKFVEYVLGESTRAVYPRTGQKTQNSHAEETRSSREKLEAVNVHYHPFANWGEMKETLFSMEKSVASISKEFKKLRAFQQKPHAKGNLKKKLAENNEVLYSYLNVKFEDIRESITTVEVLSTSNLKEMKEMLASTTRGKQVEELFAEGVEKKPQKEVMFELQTKERRANLVVHEVSEAMHTAAQGISPNTLKRKAARDPQTTSRNFNEGLKKLSEELGVTLEDPIIAALQELGEVSSFGRSPGGHLWNRKSVRVATLAESLEYVFSKVIKLNYKKTKVGGGLKKPVDYCPGSLNEIKESLGVTVMDSVIVAMGQLEKFYRYPFGRSPAVEELWNRRAGRVATLVESVEFLLSHIEPSNKRRKFAHDILSLTSDIEDTSVSARSIAT